MSNAANVIAGGAAVVLRVQDETRQQLNSIGQRFRAIASGMAERMQVASAAIAGVARSIVGHLREAATAFAAHGDTIAKAARRVGVSASAFSELDYAIERSGGNIADLEAALRTMNRTVAQAANGSTTARNDLAALGLTLDDLSGLSPDQVLEVMAERLQGIQNPVLRAERAMAIFGRAGSRILPMLNDDIAALRQQARNLNIGLSDEDASSAEALTDALTNFNRVMRSVTITIGAAVAPALTSILEQIALVARGVTQFINDNRGLVTVLGTVAAAVIGAVAVFGAAGVAVSATMSAISGAIAAIGGIVGAVFSPMGLAIAGIAAVVYLLYRNWSEVVGILDQVGQAAMSLGVAATSGLGNVARGANRLLQQLARMASGAASGVIAAFRDLALGDGIFAGLLRSARSALQSLVEMIRQSPVGQAFGAVFNSVTTLFNGLSTTMQNAFRGLASNLTGAFSAAFGSLGRVVGAFASSVWQTLQDALGGIWDALNAGDLAGAFEVALLTMQVLWANLLATLQGGWRAFTGFMTDAFWSAVQFVGESFLGVARSILDAMRGMIDGVAGAVEAMVMTVARQINQFIADTRNTLDRFNPFGAGREQVERDRRAADEAVERSIRGVREQRQALTGRVFDPLARATEQARQSIRQLGPRQDRDQRNREAEAEERRPVEAVQRQLTETLERQRIDREIQETIRYLQSFDRNRGFDDRFDLDGLDQTTRRFATRSTFNAAAASLIADGDTLAERTAQATEQTARNTQQIIREIRQIQSRFE